MSLIQPAGNVDKYYTKQHIKVIINNTSGVFEKGHTDRGLLYDIWKQIREQLKDKYEFEEKIVKIGNYNKLVDMIERGDADMVIAPFQITVDRSEKVNFTMTILESKDTILYFPKYNTLDIVKMLMLKVFIGPLILLFVLGILSGIMLYYMEPKRYRVAGVKKSMGLRRAITTTTSALFGEAGFLSENTTLTIKGIVTVYMIMIFAFFFVMYIQAVTTEKVLDVRKINTIDRDNIHTKTLLAPTGYAIAKNIERLGANIEYVNKPLDQIVDEYIKDPTIADGVAIDYLQGKTRERPDIKLFVNESDLGFKEITYAVAKSRKGLLEDVNYEIVKLQDSLRTENICKSYMPGDASYLCVK